MCCNEQTDKWCRNCCWELIREWELNNFYFGEDEKLSTLNNVITIYISLGGVSIDEVSMKDMWEYIFLKYNNRKK